MPDKIIHAYNVDNPDDEKSRKTCQYPEVTECPSCHYAIEPKPLGAYFTIGHVSAYETYRLNLLCLCKRCRQVFMSEFHGCYCQNYGSRYVFSTAEFSLPYAYSPPTFPKEITKLSPNFAETYSQAEIAESHNLHQICGVGYRKALEFLVKDYLCHKSPDSAEAIRPELLGASIKRIDDPRIKTLAERSTWIGNDETHYVRKHEELDVSDMKRFIKALLTYVESDLAFEEALGITRK